MQVVLPDRGTRVWLDICDAEGSLSGIHPKERNGAQLGWLIDADRRVVFGYRQGQAVEEVRGAAAIDGEGPVAGFRLDLEPVWQGL